MIAAVKDTQGDSAAVIEEFGLSEERVYEALKSIRGSRRVDDPRAESHYRSLEKYTIDLTKLASEGKTSTRWLAGIMRYAA